MGHKTGWLVIALFLACTITLDAQWQKPQITNFTTSDYGRGREAACFSVCLDNHGLVYAANAGVVLEYDASSWNTIGLTKSVWVLSLDKSKDGVVHVGAQNEIGYLKIDSTGKKQYVSLNALLSEEEMFYSNVWFTHCLDDKVVYQSEEQLMVFHDDTLSVIYPETSFHSSFKVQGELIIRQRGIGLMKLSGDTTTLLPNGEAFDTIGIFSILPYQDDGTLLVASPNNGLWLYNMNSGKTQGFNPKLGKALADKKVYGGIALSDGNFAFNTLLDGVVIVNKSGDILQVINKHSGLKSNEIKDIYQDKFNNLWLATGNGISHVLYSSPLSYYKESSGIAGSVNSIQKFKGKIYVGSSEGLFVQDMLMNNCSDQQFVKVPGVNHQVFDLLKANDQLIIGTEGGLFTIQDDVPVKINDINTYALYYIEDKNLLLTGGNTGLYSFQAAGNWQTKHRFDTITEDIIGIAHNNTNITGGEEYWLGTRYEGAIRLVFKDDYTNPLVLKLDPFTLLINEWIIPFEFEESVIFGTRDGIIGFKQLDKSNPDSLEFGFASLFDSVVTNPCNTIYDSKNKTWITRDYYLAYFDKTNNGKYVNTPFLNLDMGKISDIYQDGSTWWIGTANGLASFDEAKNKNYSEAFNTLIRTVSLKDEEVIFHGNARENQPARKLPYQQNSILFNYTGVYHEDNSHVEYAYMLEGYDEAWSEYSNQSFKGYTNLKEGTYTFKVKARNIYGTGSSVDSFSFSISPPWYRTFWAYVLYVLLFLLVLYLGIRVSIYQLKKKNEKLERIVEERTAEIKAKNKELEYQRDEIGRQKDEIMDSIEYAQRIQEALLPPAELLENNLPDHFVLFKPRDIVSGDFYWMKRVDNLVVVTAADCTGHGVPGAFMSMLGISFLNEIVNDQSISSDMILNQLRDRVKTSLRQTGKESEQKDGMDMALCVLDLENNTMQFSGAFNPLYLVRDGELISYKADRQPIAIHLMETEFTMHQVELQKGDIFYMFSDGYADQFGGEKSKKLMTKGFKKILMEIHQLPMKKQKELLDTHFEEWRRELEQMDDVVVLGIRI